MRRPGFPNRENASLYSFLVVFALCLVLAGCAGVDKTAAKRSVSEMYDSAMNSYLEGHYDDAQKDLKTLLEEYPLTPKAIDAQLLLADVCYDMEDYDDASAYYTSFVSLHPMHSRAAYALFKKGMSHFKEVLTLDRDQTATKKALFAFEDLVASYPDSAYFARSKELIKFLKTRLAEREFYVANFYFKNSNYKGALGRLRDILKDYPDEGITDKALYYIGESYRKLGEKDLARDTFATLIKEFPQSPFVKDAQENLDKG